MTNSKGTVLRILRILVESLAPLDGLLADMNKVQSLFIEIGLQVPVVPQSILNLRQPVQELRKTLVTFEELLLAQGEASPEAFRTLDELIAALAGISIVLESLPSQLEADFASYPDLLDEIDMLELVKRLSSKLLCEYLRTSQIPVYNLGILLGIITVDEIGAGTSYMTAHTKYQIHWDRFTAWFTAPSDMMENLYGWGTAVFAPQLLLERIQYLLLSLGYPSRIEQFQDESSDGIYDKSDSDMELHLPVFSEVGENAMIGIDCIVRPTELVAEGDQGILFIMSMLGAISVETQLTASVSLSLAGAINTTGGLGIEIRPPFLVQPVVGDAAEFEAAAGFQIQLSLTSASGDRIALLQQPGLLTLDFGGATLKFTLDLSTESSPQFQVEARLQDGLLAIGGGEADGFLKEILPPEGILAPFEISLGWRSDDGFYILGSGGIDVAIPIHLSLGPVELRTLHAGLGFQVADAPEFWSSLGVTLGAELGPLTANVKRIGIKALLSFPGGRSGNLGDADLAIQFIPPTGAGFSIDSAITGGGFMEFDTKNERYSGILALKFGEIAITAIGLITTKMPDGSKGFSMLVNVGVIFDPPIELSSGFTLSGIGGLIGINRTVDIDVLRAGVKKKTLDSILFPDITKVIVNADKIISDMR